MKVLCEQVKVEQIFYGISLEIERRECLDGKKIGDTGGIYDS